MGKKKVSIIAVAVLTCIVCISMIAGATFALFTDNDHVDVSVTTASLAVSADIGEVTTASSLAEENSRLATSYDTAVKKLTVTNMLPGDIVMFPVTVTSSATVDVKYRMSFGCASADSALFDQLLLGVADAKVIDDETGADVTTYDYYVSSVSAWDTIYYSDDASAMTVTKYVSIELPAYVNAKDMQNQSCDIVFAVEAVQANGQGTSEAQSVRAYRVTNDEQLNAAVAALADGDVVVLDSIVATDWNLTYAGPQKTFTIKGFDVATLTVDAPNATIEYIINKTANVIVKSVDSQSMHIYGQVGSLTVNDGHVVVEESAVITEQIVVAPVSASDVANVVVKTQTAAVPEIAISEDSVGALAITVEDNVVVDKVVNNATADVDAALNINGSVAAVEGATDNLAIESKVVDEATFKKAMALGGEIVLANDIAVESTLTFAQDVSIDLNGKTLVQSAKTKTLNTVKVGCNVAIANGNWVCNFNNDSSTSATAFEVKGTLSLNKVNSTVNFLWERDRNLSYFYVYNVFAGAIFDSVDSNIVLEIELKYTNRVATPYAISVSGTVTVNGGSIVSDNGITVNSSGTVSVSKVNFDYKGNAIKAAYGAITVGDGLTFSGALENPAIYVKESITINDESATEWTYVESKTDCAMTMHIIDYYVCGNYIKAVETSQYGEHTAGEPVYQDMMYRSYCTVCGSQAGTPVLAGCSEELYFPVVDVNSLINAALNATAYIKLENDITVKKGTQSIALKDGCVLDLNGHTITVTYSCELDISGTNITITNGKICATAENSYALRLNNLESNNGPITVKDIEFKGGINILRTAATIENCSADANDIQYYAIYACGTAAQVTVKSGTYVHGTYGMVTYAEQGASIIIEDGTFYGRFGGSGAQVNGGTVIEHVSTAAALGNALVLDLPNYTIVLDADIAVNSAMAVSGNLTLDLNGHAITATIAKKTNLFTATGTSKFTVKNGTIKLSKSMVDADSVISATENSTVTCEGLTILYDYAGMHSMGHGVSSHHNADLIIKDCFIQGGTAVGTDANIVAGYEELNQNITIENSTLEGFATGLLYNVPAKLTISGSTISGINEAVLLRAGEAVITGGRLYNTLESRGEVKDGKPVMLTPDSGVLNVLYNPSKWGSGVQNMPLSVLVVGCATAAYSESAICTLNGVTIEDTYADYTDSKDVWMEHYGILVWGNEAANRTAVCAYDSATKFVQSVEHDNLTKCYGNATITEIAE